MRAVFDVPAHKWLDKKAQDRTKTKREKAGGAVQSAITISPPLEAELRVGLGK
jgi:hypothetical protein